MQTIYDLVLNELERANSDVCDAFNDDVVTNRERVSKNALRSLRIFVSYLCKAIYFLDQNIVPDFAAYEHEAKAVRYCRASFPQIGILYDRLNSTFMHVASVGDESIRLYFAFRDLICDVQQFAETRFHIHFLAPFDDYPCNLDKTLRKYYELVDFAFVAAGQKNLDDAVFYVDREKPIIIGSHRLFYELTLIPVGDTGNKFGRLVVFSKNRVKDNYAIKTSLVLSSIQYEDHPVPVTLLKDWEVSIRPCELNRICYLTGKSANVQRKSRDYQNLMALLKNTSLTLTSICSSDAVDLAKYEALISNDTKSCAINTILSRCHAIIVNQRLGYRTIRYVLYRANYDLLKKVSVLPDKEPFMGTYISRSCYPFEQLPFARSLPEHNPPFSDLIFTQPVDNYDYQYVYRYLHDQLMNGGRMYVSKEEIKALFPKADELIARYNKEAYNPEAMINSRFDFYYIKKSEDDFVGIVHILKNYLSKGILNFQALRMAVSSHLVTCLSEDKETALNSMFSNDRVALIYGPAGSGKTTLLSSLSTMFQGKSCLFLANTYAALNNMRIQTGKDGCAVGRVFRAVAAFARRSQPVHYDAVFIDECSTISNEDCYKCLSRINTDCLVLVGDPQQIEAIEFGNWFSLASKFMPLRTQTFLTEDHRSVEGSHLLKLWGDVRNEKIQEASIDLETNHFCQPINSSIFDYRQADQIILALNYDGVYGVNNLNSILQAGNPSDPIVWRQRIYKKGDPVVFTATDSFSNEIYNNLKGIITDVDPQEKRIFFTVKVHSNQMSVGSYKGFECLSSGPDGFSVIRFFREKPNQEYFDNDGDNRYLIPFQIAYAVSIHKAQGLEFDSVKIVVTEEAGEHVTKNIFYTAITRSKCELCIYWSPEVQAKVLANAKTKQNNDYQILLASNLM